MCVIHNPDSKCESFIPLTEERLEKLNSVKQKRLSQPATSPFRFPEICPQIPDSISPGFGYHRDCYQSFTKNLNRLQDEASKLPDSNNPARLPSGAGDRVIFQRDCIYSKGKQGERRSESNHLGQLRAQHHSTMKVGGQCKHLPRRKTVRSYAYRSEAWTYSRVRLTITQATEDSSLKTQVIGM